MAQIFLRNFNKKPLKSNGKYCRQFLNVSAITPVDIQKAIYEKSKTKQGISNVVSAVFNLYKFTSLRKQLNLLHGKSHVDTHISGSGKVTHQ